MRTPDIIAGWIRARARLRGLWLKAKARLLGCDFRIGPDFEISGPALMTNGWHGRIRVGRGIIMDDLKITLLRGASFTVGDRVSANRGLVVACMQEIRIGDGCMIAEYVSIRDFTHRIVPGVAMKDSGFDCAPIVIGANVWIGRGALIMPGVTIGDNSIIGAHAVVNRSIPANSVAVGMPARVIRDLAAEAVIEASPADGERTSSEI